MATKVRATSNMRSLRKGDKFFDGEDLIEVNSNWPENLGNGKVRVSIWVSTADRPSRRTYTADRRVVLL
jgi:hypothetical protein